MAHHSQGATHSLRRHGWGHTLNPKAHVTTAKYRLQVSAYQSARNKACRAHNNEPPHRRCFSAPNDSCLEWCDQAPGRPFDTECEPSPQETWKNRRTIRDTATTLSVKDQRTDNSQQSLKGRGRRTKILQDCGGEEMGAERGDGFMEPQ